MEGLTLAIALPAAVLCLVLRPVYALWVFFIVLFGYSQWLTVPVAGLNFTTGRIVAFALLANVIIRSKGRPLRWCWLDTLVLGYFFCALYAYSRNVETNMVLQRQSGELTDTVLPYFIVRCALKTREDVLLMFKGLVIIAIPLALMGVFESITGINPMGFLSSGYAYGLNGIVMETEMRHGLHRAAGTMGIHIIFGLFFAGVAPLALGLWHQRFFSKGLLAAICGVLVLGLFSSMSSAPWLAGFLSVGFLLAFPLRRYWPIFTAILLLGIVFMEVFSNRHFYEVMTIFSFNDDTAYYRVGLINEVLEGGMRGHWLYGYGFVGIGPGNDNTFFTWFYNDLVNLYIAILARTGLLALIPYLALNTLYYRRLYVASKRAKTLADKWMIWCIAATLVSWNIAMMTVSAMNQVQTMLYMLMAVSTNLPELVKQGARAPHYRLMLMLRRRVLLQRLLATAEEERHG